MTNLVLLIAMLTAVSLAFEIGIASWNIHRAKRYQRKEEAAQQALDAEISVHKADTVKLQSLERYVSDISWLLNFLYAEYDNFSAIEKSLEEIRQKRISDMSIKDKTAEKRLEDLKNAARLIRITVKAAHKINGLTDSLFSLLDEILDEDEEDDCSEDNSELSHDIVESEKESCNCETCVSDCSCKEVEQINPAE
jgi:hypothetical protein